MYSSLFTRPLTTEAGYLFKPNEAHTQLEISLDGEHFIRSCTEANILLFAATEIMESGVPGFCMNPGSTGLAGFTCLSRSIMPSSMLRYFLVCIISWCCKGKFVGLLVFGLK